MKYEFKTSGTCSTKITFDLEDNIVRNISFYGGCPGNTLALSKVLEGQTVAFIVEKLSGNLCGIRKTSCADQLAKFVKEAYEKER